MAVAGSGGWVPSCGYIYRFGRLERVGITQNKPTSCLQFATEAAAMLLEDGDRIVQIDVRNLNALKLSAEIERLKATRKDSSK